MLDSGAGSVYKNQPQCFSILASYKLFAFFLRVIPLRLPSAVTCRQFSTSIECVNAVSVAGVCSETRHGTEIKWR